MKVCVGPPSATTKTLRHFCSVSIDHRINRAGLCDRDAISRARRACHWKSSRKMLLVPQIIVDSQTSLHRRLWTCAASGERVLCATAVSAVGTPAASAADERTSSSFLSAVAPSKEAQPDFDNNH